MGRRRVEESDDEGLSDEYDDSNDELDDSDLEEGGGRDRNRGRGKGDSHSLSHRSDTYDEEPQWDGDLRQLGMGEEDFYDRMVTSLTGRTTGRRLKRVIFKYGIVHLIIGFILIVISSYEDFNYGFLPIFNYAKYGASVKVSAYLFLLSIFHQCLPSYCS